MTLAALIFDVDGTLAETEEAHRQAFNAAFASAGLDWQWSVEDYRGLLKVTGGKERMRHFRDLVGGDGPDDDRIVRLHCDKTNRYARSLASGGLALRPGVAGLIAVARRAGLAVAVATTTNRPNVEALCRCCFARPADAVFDAIAAGDEVARKKPAPDVYDLALRRLGLSAGRAMAFEDSRNGLLSARAAGLPVVIAPSAYTGDEDFTGATLRVGNLADPAVAALLSGAIRAGHPA